MSLNGFPGLPAAELESRGAAWTAREIAQQPDVWKEVGGLAYICDRGRLGSPAFEAYREKKYDQISCSLAQ